MPTKNAPRDWAALEARLRQLSNVARMKREGLPEVVIARHVGWTEAELRERLAAAEALSRRGIRMTRRDD